MLEKIILINYRNIANAQVNPSAKTTIILGENGQGKTNLIEAIYLTCTLKSARASFDKELIRFGEEAAKIISFFDQDELEISIFPWGKQVRLNSRAKKILDVLGKFKAVIFSPNDLQLVFGPPLNRRKFLDTVLALVDNQYLYNLASYYQSLKQRNKALFYLSEGGKQDLDIWNQELINYGSHVWGKRVLFLKNLNNIFKKISNDLSNLGSLHIEYQPTIKIDTGDGEKQIKQKFARELVKVKNKEIKFKTTLTGPHRDDFKVISEALFGDKVISKDLGSFGSQGEARIASLCLKLAQIDYFKERDDKPALLLDDIFSELDKGHQANVLKILDKNQTIITTNTLDVFPSSLLKKALILKIVGGELAVFKDD